MTINLQHKTIPELFQSTAEKFPLNTFMQIKSLNENSYEKYTYSESLGKVKSIAKYLSKISSKDDKIAVFSENCPEWLLAYLGITYAGLTAVPLDANLPDESLSLFLNHSDSSAIFTSRKFAERIEKLKPSIKKLKKIITFEEAFSGITSITKVQQDFQIPKNLSEKSVASIVYTSGTSGTPKGVMLTHENLLYDIFACRKRFAINNDDSLLLILPLNHIFAFTAVFLSAISGGAGISFVRTLKKNEILETIKETQTTVICAVPQLFESFYKGILDKISELPAHKKLIVKSLLSANNVSLGIMEKNLGKIFFKQVHENIGRDLRFMVSGGAAIKKDVLKGMYLFGFPIFEGYGLTETSPVATVCSPGKKFGSAGKPLDGIDVKIHEPNSEGIGEIIIQGPILMKGYYKNPELTEKTIKDNWLHTKDLGYIDRDGYLYIKGRKDNMIVLQSGKNVYPEDVEHHYSKSPLIQEICVLGVRHKDLEHEVVHALIVPNLDEISKQEISDVNSAIKSEIEKLSKKFPSWSRIFSFDIVKSEELPKTSTLKVKKFEVKDKMFKRNRNKTTENKIGELIIAVLKKYSRKKDFNLNSHLETDLHLDSIAIAEIISNIEEKLSIKIPYDLNVSISTVSDLIALAEKYVQQISPNEIKKIESMEISEAQIDNQIPARTEFDENSRIERINWLKKISGVNLRHIEGAKFPTEKLKGNIEHYIGMSQIPTGIAGPLKVNGEHAKGIFFVPLATTEGALVASATRGMNIITKSGGANVRVISEQMTKAPMFIFKDIPDAVKFLRWVEGNEGKLKQIAQTASRFGKLIKIERFLLGRRAILKLCYTTGDAMGANMITMCSQKVYEYILKNYQGIEDSLFQCNVEGEKKVTYMNFFTGRGKNVVAEITIPSGIVEKFLHTTVDRISTVAQNSYLGAMYSGMIGVNAHIANILTAVFIASGQDAAHVHDSSVGITVIEKTKSGDLYISVNIPSLEIGTVGGGTSIGTQKECLEILGCYGAGKVNKLAEIFASAVLAGEISLAGSQSAGDFAVAHDKLGRNRPEYKK